MEEIANPFRGEPAAQRYARGRLDVHAEFARRIVWATGGKPLQAALDLGCGTGLSTTALASAAERVVGLDPSAPMIAEAAARCTARWVLMTAAENQIDAEYAASLGPIANTPLGQAMQQQHQGHSTPWARR